MEGTPFGRYRLIEVLGRGGMGEVWRAFDTDTNRVVALKVLPANLASDPQFEQRFRREAFAAAGLAEPHVVPIHNFGEIEGRLYVDMRLIEGQDLTALLARGPLESARAVLIIDQIASALDEAHRIGLVHRDVKPSNILVGAKDFAYLIDFGIARAAGQTKLTGTGNVIGTWAYLAPERVTTGQTDPRADIYSLACVLHECLTGSQPFPGDSIEQQIGGHLGLPPPRPSQLRDDLPTELDTVIATGMAKNPDDRYTTASALANAARAAITEPISRPAMPPTEPARRNEFRTRPAQLLSPQEPTPNGPPPTDPTRASAAQQGQPSVHTLPTEHRSATDPNADTPVPSSSTGTAHANPWKRHRVAIRGRDSSARGPGRRRSNCGAQIWRLLAWRQRNPYRGSRCRAIHRNLHRRLRPLCAPICKRAAWKARRRHTRTTWRLRSVCQGQRVCGHRGHRWAVSREGRWCSTTSEGAGSRSPRQTSDVQETL